MTGTASCTTTATPSSPVTGSPYPITCTAGTLQLDQLRLHLRGRRADRRHRRRLTRHRRRSRLKTYGDANPPLHRDHLRRLRQRRDPGARPASPAIAEPDHDRRPFSAWPAARITITAGRARPGLRPTTPSAYVTGELTVTPATLTVTADDKTKAYGDANPALHRRAQRLRQRRDPGHVRRTGAADRQPPTAASRRGRQPVPDHLHGRHAWRRQLRLHLRGRRADRHHGDPDGHRRRQDQDLRRRQPAPVTYELSGFVNGETLARPASPARRPAPRPPTSSRRPAARTRSPPPGSLASDNYTFSFVNGEFDRSRRRP